MITNQMQLQYLLDRNLELRRQDVSGVMDVKLLEGIHQRAPIQVSQST